MNEIKCSFNLKDKSNNSIETLKLSLKTLKNECQKVTLEKTIKDTVAYLLSSFLDTLLGNEDMSVFAALGNDDPGDETFEQLFEKMRVMKGKLLSFSI